MTSEKMITAINEQINKELFSAYLYLSMASWFEDQGLAGFANWMQVQAQEEVSHGMKLYRYVFERGGRAVLAPIDGPDTEWKSVLAAFEHTLEHERFVSSRIDGLMALARDEKDYATEQMLQWFVAEQVEEEANAQAIIDQVKLIGDSGHGLYQLDQSFVGRVFVDETQSE